MTSAQWTRAVMAAAACLAPMAFAAGTPHKNLPLCDFTRADHRARFTPRGAVRADGDAGRYVFAKWKSGDDQWPALVMAARNGVPSNWASYDDLVLSVTNESAQPVDLAGHLLETDWGNETRYFKLKPGDNEVRFPLYETRVVNTGSLRELHLYVTRPPAETPLVFADLRLEENLQPRLARTMGRLGDVEKSAARDGFAGLTKDDIETGEQLAKAIDSAGTIAEREATRRGVEILEKAAVQSAPRRLTDAKMRRDWRKIDARTPYALGFATSMEKVFPRDIPFQAKVSRSTALSVARNESEAVQLLILGGDEDLKDVRVEVGPLAREGGSEVLTASVAPMGFVQTKTPPYRADYVGWYPDPILDFLKSFDVKAGDMQPVWISVKPPSGTKPGEYVGGITVHPANAPSRTLEMRVNVWGFDLPKETHLRTALSYREPFVEQVYGELTPEMNRRYEEFLLTHRMNPDNIYRYDPPAVEDVVRWDKLGMNAFNITYAVKPADLKPNASYPAEAKAKILDVLDTMIPQYKAAGVYDKAYVYGFDEVRPDSHNAMTDIFGAIKAKYPDLPNLTTAYDATYGEATNLPQVDNWVPLTDKYDLGRAEGARAKGKKVWWYICLVPKAPFANILIEYPAIDARMLMGLQTAKYRPDGFLYYAVNRWPLSKKSITTGPYTDWPTRSIGELNGDGSFLCAGPDGPLSTIRMENLTDGLEDNEYFWLLGQEIERLEALPGPAAAKAVEKAKAVQAIGDDLVASLTSYTTSPEAVYAKRKQVAEAILAARKIR
jgi:hypothetical protein